MSSSIAQLIEIGLLLDSDTIFISWYTAEVDTLLSIRISIIFI